jgi:hypothetical protein
VPAFSTAGRFPLCSGYSARMDTLRHLAAGMVAGAAGTTAINTVTYLDMVVRGRPASTTPEQTVDRMLELADVRLPGEPPQRRARRSGLGALLGSVAGVGAGVVVAAMEASASGHSPARTMLGSWGVAMLVGNGPMTMLGVTDPRTWSRQDWTADVVPHLAYAAAATATLELTLSPR